MSDKTPPSETRIELQRRLPAIWLLPLLLAAVILPSRVWTTLLIGLGGLLGIAYFWAWQLAHGLQAQRRLRFGWVAVGDRLSESFEIYNGSRVPALWVEIVDESNVPGYRAAVVRSVDSQSFDRWKMAAVCQQRGQFHLGPWALRAGDPFGIFRVTISRPTREEIVIHPPIHIDIPIPLPAGQSSGRSRARERSWQATVNAATVRAYQPRDSLRWVHWPTSARRDELFVRQFDLDAAGDVWLLLDMQDGVHLGQGIDGTEEHAVLLAAALASQGLRQSRPIGLAGYSRLPRLVPPARGQGQRWRLLRALALVSADGHIGLSQALQDLGRVAQRGSAAVIITPSGTADWLPDLLHLAQRGVRPQVVLLNRASFAEPSLDPSQEEGEPASSPPEGLKGDVPASAPPEGLKGGVLTSPPLGGIEGGSEGLRDAVRGLGINCYLIRQGEIGRPAVEQERRGFWEFRVTGTGKVITVRSPDDFSPSPGRSRGRSR